MNKKTFLKGAALLLAANFAVKAAGAIFKIPLARLLGDEGMGIFSTASSVYMWAVLLAGGGIPVAVSRKVSEYSAKNDFGSAKKAFCAGTFLTLITSILTCFILYRFSGYIALQLGVAGAKAGIVAACPAVVFVSLTAVMRSFFEGRQNMVPTALSEVSEAIGKLFIGYILAKLLIKNGIAEAAAGALWGISAGAFVGFIIMLFVYFGRKRKYKKSHVNIIKILLSIIKTSVPVLLCMAVSSLSGVIDTAMIMKRLAVAGLTENEALAQWGRYSGFVMPLANLPASILASVSISVVPAIAGAFFSGQNSLAVRITKSALRLCVVFALPCGAGLSLLSAPILNFVYGTDRASALLGVLGWSVIPVSICIVTTSVLQGIGKETKPVIYMLAGSGVKALLNHILVAIPSVGIMGAPIGTIACYTLISLLNIVAISKTLNIHISVSDFTAPLISCVGMAICTMYFYNAFGNLILAIGIGAGIYFLLLLLTGALTSEDISVLPKGEKMAEKLKKLKLIRR